MMADDITLGLEMGRLKIEPYKIVNHIKEENPFYNPVQKKTLNRKYTLHISNYMYLWQKKKNKAISKKKHNKVLREPILRLSSPFKTGNLKSKCQLFNRNLLENRSYHNLNSASLCSLVDNCNLLSISSDKGETRISKVNDSVKEFHHLKTIEAAHDKQSRESSERSSTGSCSQQALNPPCDVTIDELASYFETLVHIPKKMSSMAEMMYI